MRSPIVSFTVEHTTFKIFEPAPGEVLVFSQTPRTERMLWLNDKLTLSENYALAEPDKPVPQALLELDERLGMR